MKSEIELKFLELLKKSPKSKEEVEQLLHFGRLLEEESNNEIKDLIYELKNAGIIITSIWDLVNTKKPYPEAIDILIKHVPVHYHDKNREGIFRALTVKEAKRKANAALIAEYKKIPTEKDNLRWVIGNAIYVIVVPNDIESILPIVEDKQNGMSRYRFVLALGKVKSEKGENALIELLDDYEMSLYALQALARLKSKKAKDKISLLATSSNISIKKEAQRTLKKIG
jgi:hypothetical protein